MGLDVNIYQKKFLKKSLPFKVILGNLSFGSMDEYERLREGEMGGNGFVMFNPAHIGRGIGVEWSPLVKSKVYLRLPFPASAEDIDDFYDVAERICAYWKVDEIEQDGGIVPVSGFPAQREHQKNFNLEVLNGMSKDEAGNLCQIFGAIHPLFLGDEDRARFSAAESLDSFRDFMHERQSIDAYYASPGFYKMNNSDEITGTYFITEGVRSIVPKEPYVPFRFEAEVSDWQVCLASETRDCAVGRCNYADFIGSLAGFSAFDDKHIVIEGLSLEKIDEIIDKHGVRED
jgi:hypothetical protein